MEMFTISKMMWIRVMMMMMTFIVAEKMIMMPAAGRRNDIAWKIF